MLWMRTGVDIRILPMDAGLTRPFLLFLFAHRPPEIVPWRCPQWFYRHWSIFFNFQRSKFIVPVRGFRALSLGIAVSSPGGRGKRRRTNPNEEVEVELR